MQFSWWVASLSSSSDATCLQAEQCYQEYVDTDTGLTFKFKSGDAQGVTVSILRKVSNML